MAPLPPSPPPHPTETPQDGLLSSAFRHLPFSSPRPPSKPSNLDPTAPGDARNAPSAALASAADRLLRELGAAASYHPFIKPILSLHSEFRSFFQVRCRNSRSLNLVSTHNFAAILPGDSVAGLVVANGINSFLNLYNTVLVVRLVLTWFPNSPPAIVSPLSTVCDPYLNIFRGIIPPLGGLDLSPILAFLVLNAFTSTAAALPAELPVATTASQQSGSSHPLLQNLTATQEKWVRRVVSKRSKNYEDGN